MATPLETAVEEVVDLTTLLDATLDLLLERSRQDTETYAGDAA